MVEQTCPACQLPWRPWFHDAKRRRYQEFVDLCTPCYVRKTDVRRKREARERTKESAPTVTKRKMAPWLTAHPELYQGPEAAGRPHHRLPEQRRAAVPSGMGGESHGEFILQPSVGRHVPHRAAAI